MTTERMIEILEGAANCIRNGEAFTLEKEVRQVIDELKSKLKS